MRFFSNMKIGTRLGWGFVSVLALSAMMTAVGIWRLEGAGDAARDMTELSKVERGAADWLRSTSINAARTVAVAKSNDPDVRKFFQKEISAESRHISQVQKELEGLITSAEGKSLLSKVGERRKAYLEIRNGIFKLQEDGGDQNAAKEAVDSKLVPALNSYVEAVQDVLDNQKQRFESASASIESIIMIGRGTLIALGLVAMVIGALLAWAISRSITRPLAHAVKVARAVASGNLASRIDVSTQDETGQLLQALKEMNDSLLNIVSKVRQGTESIATASSQIASGNLDLSSRTEQQASSLEETASSMEELTSTVKQNAENAMQANALTASATEVAGRGGAVVAQVVDTMASINESSKKIVDIISVIDGIAFQTNILALNAAVEAARAGEQGRGFAVVASEVRNLAQRSAAAAKEIKTLIGDSVTKVDEGAKFVGEAGATMEEIVDSVKRVTTIMGEIMSAAQEQSAGIDQINQAIAQMDQVTQQNAALVEEAAAASEAMQDQATHLAQVVSVFKIDTAHTLAAAPAPVARTIRTDAPARKPAQLSSAKAATPARKRVPATSSSGDWEEF